ncbi:hypothetical protein EXS45_02130 [Candidatus Nomurabacteria bacterium]|nr:hypothetical protein [Candidatus Nomurabacteria bacterium]
MKKSLLITLIAIIGIFALGVGWIILQKGHSSVYITVNNTSDENIEEIKKQFAIATDNRLQLTCESSNGIYKCSGRYEADNLIQLNHYQNNLFGIEEKNKNIDFESFAGDSFFAID